ncbi:hypothetical protein F5148DRAFT_1289063 [Russula earlei]|uniref:Uncharacterized protein n=1 Tax=Russula earlei TaxID=71964 RepID=A0ACC0TZU7_9AGAM|nr:hypothetical protein F5148DRAFT_1289063 [Russula earlei]
MKKVLPAAIIIAACAFIVVACKWFKTNTTQQPFSIVGNWKVDSFYTVQKTGDSSLFALFADARKNPVGVSFQADSIVILPSRKDTTAYYLKDSTVFIKEDSSFVPYHLAITSDSRVSLTSADSVVLVLKK